MNITKSILIKSLLGLVLVGGGIVLLKSVGGKGQGDKAVLTIGILQTASHPALDQARDGFIEQVKKKLGSSVELVVQNAEGSLATAQAIAKSFHANPRVSGICTIATMATQVMATIEKEKPIFISAVSDAQALGVVHPGSNVCGTSDWVDVEVTIQSLRLLLPEVKTVALLHNPAEINAASSVKEMQRELDKHQIAWISVGVNSEADIVHAVNNAVSRADAILVPTDNTIACAMEMVGRLALKAKKPLMICYNPGVTAGVLAAAGGVDYKDLGTQTAGIAVKVLVNHEKPAILSIAKPHRSKIIIHRATAQALHVKVPVELENKVMWVD